MSDDITVKDCLAGAFAALLRGDTKERDRLCDLAQTAFHDNVTPIPSDTPIFKKPKNMTEN